MRRVNCTYARIRVVVGVHAETKRSRAPQWRGTPVIVVVLKAVHLLRQAFLFQLGLLFQLSFLLPQAFLLQSSSFFSGKFLLVFLRFLAVTRGSRFHLTVRRRATAIVTARGYSCIKKKSHNNDISL